MDDSPDDVALAESAMDDTSAREDEEDGILEPMQFDDSLPPGWGRRCVQRAAGVSAGKWDVYLISPDGRKFKSRGQLQSYFDRKNITEYTAEDFDFTVRGRSNFGLRVKRQGATIPENAVDEKKKVSKKGKKVPKVKPNESKKSVSKMPSSAVSSSKLVVKMNFKQTRSRKQLKRKKPVKKAKNKPQNLKDGESSASSSDEEPVEAKREVNVFDPVELKSSPRKRKLSVKLLESESVSKKMIDAATNEIVKKSKVKVKKSEKSEQISVGKLEITGLSKPVVGQDNPDNTLKVSLPVKKGPKIKVIKGYHSPNKNVILPAQKVQTAEPKKRGRKKGSKNKVKRAPNTLKSYTKKQQKTPGLAYKHSQSEMVAYSFPQASMHDRQLSDNYISGIHTGSPGERTILRGPSGSKVETDIINGQKVTYVTILPAKGSGEYLVLDSGHTYAKKPRYIISRTPITSTTTIGSSASPSRVIVTSLPSSKPMLSCIKPIHVGPVVDVAAYETV
ncbi:uncharacterized protein LOC141901451 isoform X2 [Tubulanus polymorphus]|uniref:uncharacterized protein LOC141901451 isoform X2 n=1 Tax=Tubulanus polymorphus TaxID=672921 RepID=UPI003DA61BCB